MVLLVACAEQAMKPFTIMNQFTLINWIVSRFLIATTFLSVPALLAGTETLEDPKDSKTVPPTEIKPWCETPSPLDRVAGSKPGRPRQMTSH